MIHRNISFDPVFVTDSETGVSFPLEHGWYLGKFSWPGPSTHSLFWPSVCGRSWMFYLSSIKLACNSFSNKSQMIWLLVLTMSVISTYLLDEKGTARLNVIFLKKCRLDLVCFSFFAFEQFWTWFIRIVLRAELAPEPLCVRAVIIWFISVHMACLSVCACLCVWDYMHVCTSVQSNAEWLDEKLAAPSAGRTWQFDCHHAKKMYTFLLYLRFLCIFFQCLFFQIYHMC